MLQVISPLKGFAIDATDGRIGNVVDFLFDDASWRLRWLVVDCGTWLEGRKVLIHPPAISFSDLEDQQFGVELTKARIMASPEWLKDQPVSQQMQEQLYEHYGWDPAYSGGSGAMASPMLAPPYLGFGIQPEPRTDAEVTDGDPRLRSAFEVIGYHAHAVDGEIGHIEDLMFDSETWSLHYFIVNTSNWWMGKRVLMAASAVTAIDWSVEQVQFDATREKIKTSPVWDPLVAFNETYKTHLHEHYGWPQLLA